MSAENTVSPTDVRLVPELKSAHKITPIIPSTRAINLYRVIFSFEMIIANSMVNTEFAEKMIAIREGASAIFTAY